MSSNTAAVGEYGSSNSPLVPTLVDVMNLLKQNQATLMENTTQLKAVVSTLDSIEGRLGGMESRVSALEDKQKKTITTKQVQAAVSELKKDMMEERQRILRKNNNII